METLQSLGSESRRKTNIKNGAGENLFGVLMGPMRKLAAKIGIDHGLALKLWETGNTDAMMLSCVVMDALQLPEGCYSSYAPEWIAAGIRLADQRKRR
jgi:hypothetical protein